jgi:hypothetical protein
MDSKADRTIALAAMLIAGASLLMASYQSCLQRENFHISVQPHVLLSFYFNRSGAGWVLRNEGLGPAVVKSFNVQIDGNQMRNWMNVGDVLGIEPGHTEYVNVPPGVFLRPSSPEAGKLFWVEASPAAATLNANRDRVHITLCACSLYEKCWITTSGRSDPTRVVSCSAPDAEPFGTQ